MITDIRHLRRKMAIKRVGQGDYFFVDSSILSNVMAVPRANIFSEDTRPVSQLELSTIFDCNKKSLEQHPLPYILHYKEFFGMNILVNINTLIPRIETETLVEITLEKAGEMGRDSGLAIIDVGTGSGCVSVCLASMLPSSRIYALDVSLDAIEMATLNFDDFGLTEKIMAIRSNILDNLPVKANIIVANLPYVESKEVSRLSKGIRNYEPIIALDGGRNGLEYINKLIQQAPTKLKKGGYLIFEIGKNQEKRIIKKHVPPFPFTQIEITPDLSGISRIISLKYD